MVKDVLEHCGSHSGLVELDELVEAVEDLAGYPLIFSLLAATELVRPQWRIELEEI